MQPLRISLTILLLVFHGAATAAGSEPDVVYVPTPPGVVEKMLRAADVSSDDVVYDLGSGDGRIVVTAARKYDATGVGIDIDSYRVAEARANAKVAGVSNKVKFVQGDLFDADLRKATAVTLYLLPSLNRKLTPKLFRELEPGTPVVSHDFDMGDWRPDMTVYVEDTEVYLWVMPAEVAGVWQLDLADERVQVELRLDQKYQDVSGRVVGSGWEAPIDGGALEGKQIRFGTALWVDGAYRTLTFKGRVNRGEMEGTAVEDASGRLYSQWSARLEKK